MCISRLKAKCRNLAKIRHWFLYFLKAIAVWLFFEKFAQCNSVHSGYLNILLPEKRRVFVLPHKHLNNPVIFNY